MNRILSLATGLCLWLIAASAHAAPAYFDHYACDQIKINHPAYVKATSDYIQNMTRFIELFDNVSDELVAQVGYTQQEYTYIQQTMQQLMADSYYKTAEYTCGKARPITYQSCAQLLTGIRQMQTYIAPAASVINKSRPIVPLLPKEDPDLVRFEGSLNGAVAALSQVQTSLSTLDMTVRTACRLKEIMVQ